MLMIRRRLSFTEPAPIWQLTPIWKAQNLDDPPTLGHTAILPRSGRRAPFSDVGGWLDDPTPTIIDWLYIVLDA